MSAVSCSSSHTVPPIGYRLTDKAICENGTHEEDEIDYKDQVADSAEETCWEDANVEKDDGGTD